MRWSLSGEIGTVDKSCRAHAHVLQPWVSEAQVGPVSESSIVLRTSTVLLKPRSDKLLREYAEYSAVLWNQANYERRKAWHNHETMPSYASQCKTLKTNEAFKKLGTCKSQALLSKLREAWSSFYALN